MLMESDQNNCPNHPVLNWECHYGQEDFFAVVVCWPKSTKKDPCPRWFTQTFAFASHRCKLRIESEFKQLSNPDLWHFQLTASECPVSLVKHFWYIAGKTPRLVGKLYFVLLRKKPVNPVEKGSLTYTRIDDVRNFTKRPSSAFNTCCV